MQGESENVAKWKDDNVDKEFSAKLAFQIEEEKKPNTWRSAEYSGSVKIWPNQGLVWYKN